MISIRGRLALAAVALAGVGVAGCSPGTPTAAPPVTVVSTVTVTATPSSPAPTSAPAPTTAAAAAEFPKFVPKSKIDKRYASSMAGDQVVQLAPGVYAEAVPGGELGTLDDYSGLTGNCAAIKRYTEAHPKAGGSTCW
ncbi:hypothetical protein [Amycolatopsis kentuckyensis]|uniref:hypothetical protein n=1 Tax=Amycolatopsis kentuckyensis TaxID=218823 RepID=UPI003563F395